MTRPEVEQEVGAMQAVAVLELVVTVCQNRKRQSGFPVREAKRETSPSPPFQKKVGTGSLLGSSHVGSSEASLRTSCIKDSRPALLF